MNNQGWIKLYRKASTHKIMRDPIAWTIFTYFLFRVDQKSGSYVTGRNTIAEELELHPSVVRNALNRLQKKYELINWTAIQTANRTANQTQIIVSKWAEYQYTGEDLDSESDSVLDPRAIVFKRNKKEFNTNVLKNETEKPVEKIPSFPKPKPDPKSHPYSEILRYCLERQGITTKFTSYPKQMKGVKLILDAGYSLDDAQFVIDEMAKEEFWKANPFDMMNVANNMLKYMNRTVMFKKGDLKGGRYAYN